MFSSVTFFYGPLLVIYGSRVLFPRVELALDPVPNRDWTVSKRRRIFRIEKERNVRGSFSPKMEIIKRRLTSFNRAVEATDESLVKTREFTKVFLKRRKTRNVRFLALRIEMFLDQR